MTTFETEYGTFEIGAGGFSSPFRYDRWTPKDGGTPAMEHYFATGPDDKSPRHSMANYGPDAGYDPKCSTCWLGHGHTKDYHARNLGGAK